MGTYRADPVKNFNKRYKKVENSECWEWTGAMRGNSGYGCMYFKGKVIDAHRISFMIHKGEIPTGLVVMHSCDNKICVNSDHLSIGTHKENARQAIERGRINKKSDSERKSIAQKIRNALSKYIIHPGLSQYNNGCRCEGCKKIKSEDSRKRTKRKKPRQ
jgi:hypothetical protein